MNFSLSDRFKLDRNDTWRLEVTKKEILILDPIDKYMYWLIFKFTLIVKKAKLITKPVSKMMIVDDITEQEKKFFIEMLYNKKDVLAWNFTKIGKVKKKVAPP